LVVTFDQPLVDDAAIDTANWTVRIADVTRTVVLAEVSAGIVVLQLAVGAADPGDDVVSFDPPPDDVIGASGLLPAPGFTDFPVTI
jgi:hypothetical protein